LVTGSLGRAAGIFVCLGEVLLEPIGSLIDRSFLSGRDSGAFTMMGASGELRKRIL
jgi:hypothetical protein